MNTETERKWFPVTAEKLRTFDLYWSPEGRKIATVEASDMHRAIRKAPMPYRKYKGEVYAVDVTKD